MPAEITEVDGCEQFVTSAGTDINNLFVMELTSAVEFFLMSLGHLFTVADLSNQVYM